jgi:pyridoxamine 5'-phosphate oxidase
MVLNIQVPEKQNLKPMITVFGVGGAGGNAVNNMIEEGFVFYTNYTGRKSEDIRSNSKAAICFYWPALEKQVRIEGIVEKVSDEESDEYFNSRPHESRVGAWTSKQSATLENRDKLLAELEANREKFKDEELTRPVFWGGWRIKPYYIEFWQAGEYRIHNRVLFDREDVTYSEWKKRLLYP